MSERRDKIIEELTKARASSSGSLNQFVLNQIEIVLARRRGVGHQELCGEVAGALEDGIQDLLRLTEHLTAVSFGSSKAVHQK